MLSHHEMVKQYERLQAHFGMPPGALLRKFLMWPSQPGAFTRAYNELVISRWSLVSSYARSAICPKRYDYQHSMPNQHLICSKRCLARFVSSKQSILRI